jgi:Short C-terminal domain
MMMRDMTSPDYDEPQYEAPPPQAAPAAPSYADELEQLAQLKAQGIVTDEEFEAKKKQILGL